MAETYGLSCSASALVPKSELSHRSEAHHGFILKLSHPIGKNSENREQSQACLSYAEVHPVFAESKNSENREQSQACLSYAEVHPVFAESNNPAHRAEKPTQHMGLFFSERSERCFCLC